MTGGGAAHPREHGPPVVRALFFVAGVVSLGLGIAGAFLPVLPTTPLVLLAAACFARSYRPFHEWLLAHRLFGPMLREWHEHRRIPGRPKLTAIAMMAVTLGTSIVFFVEHRGSRPGSRPSASPWPCGCTGSEGGRGYAPALGPDGGSATKPVGTVCFAWALRRDPAPATWVKTETRRLEGDRAAVRTQSIVIALESLVGLLKQRQDF